MSAPRSSLSYQTAKDYVDRLVTTATQRLNAAIELVIPVTIIDAATGDIDTIMADKVEVIGFTCIKRNGAGAGNTNTLKNAANALTAAIACDTDDTVTAAATIIDTGGFNVIAKGGTMRISATRAAGTRDSLCLVKVLMRP